MAQIKDLTVEQKERLKGELDQKMYAGAAFSLLNTLDNAQLKQVDGQIVISSGDQEVLKIDPSAEITREFADKVVELCGYGQDIQYYPNVSPYYILQDVTTNSQFGAYYRSVELDEEQYHSLKLNQRAVLAVKDGIVKADQYSEASERKVENLCASLDEQIVSEEYSPRSADNIIDDIKFLSRVSSHHTIDSKTFEENEGVYCRQLADDALIGIYLDPSNDASYTEFQLADIVEEIEADKAKAIQVEAEGMDMN